MKPATIILCLASLLLAQTPLPDSGRTDSLPGKAPAAQSIQTDSGAVARPDSAAVTPAEARRARTLTVISLVVIGVIVALMAAKTLIHFSIG
jgi:hypothetical protein